MRIKRLRCNSAHRAQLGSQEPVHSPVVLTFVTTPHWFHGRQCHSVIPAATSANPREIEQ
jgi:hypothetical protein